MNAVRLLLVKERTATEGHVFISYRREDSAKADWLQATLENAGIQVWRDKADIWPGQDWQQAIRNAVSNGALVFLACFSQVSLTREKSWQNEELALAIEQMRQRNPGEPWLIPVRFDDCDIPDIDVGAGRTLSSIERSDVFGADVEAQAARLVTAVLHILGRTADDATASGARRIFPGRRTTAVAGGATAAVLVGAVLSLVLISGHGRSGLTGPAGGTAISAFSSSSPVKVEGVTPLNPGPNNSWALAKPVELTAGQLDKISKRPQGGAALPSSLDPVVVSSGFTDITVTGNSKETVTINDIEIRKTCSAPLSGTLFLSPAQGLNGTIGLDFDLDSTIDYARPRIGLRVGSGNFFAHDVVTLKQGETHTFTIFVSSSDYYCSFIFQMSVVTQMGTVTENIADYGKPFQVTGSLLTTKYKALYVGGVAALIAHLNTNGFWVQQDPRTFRS